MITLKQLLDEGGIDPQDLTMDNGDNAFEWVTGSGEYPQEWELLLAAPVTLLALRDNISAYTNGM